MVVALLGSKEKVRGNSYCKHTKVKLFDVSVKGKGILKGETTGNNTVTLHYSESINQRIIQNTSDLNLFKWHNKPANLHHYGSFSK